MTVNAITTYNNFARAQLDLDMDGRFDLPIYRSGTKTFRNCISNFKGNAMFRTGFQSMVTFQDCALIEFKFSQNQNYILVLYANTIRFLSYDLSGAFGWVLDGGASILEVTTPYSLAESKEIAKTKAFTQNFDSMVITHPSHVAYELQRIAANDFSFSPHSRHGDPFGLTFAGTQGITAISKATHAQITIVAHGYVAGDSFRIAAVTGMTEINGFTVGVISVLNADNVIVSLNTARKDSAGDDIFTTYVSGGTGEKVLTSDNPKTALYYKSRLYFGGSVAEITTVWGSAAGDYSEFEIPDPIVADSPLKFTIAELTSQIEWMFKGQNSLIVGTNNQVVAVNGGSVDVPIDAESIDVTTTDATGASAAEPLAKDGFIFYTSNDGRNLMYFKYDLLSEQFVAADTNAVSYDITRNNITKVRFVKDKDDLIWCLKGNGDILTLNFNEKENIVGWHPHDTQGTFEDIAQISDNDGVEQLFTLTQRFGSFYIELAAKPIEFSRRQDFFTAGGIPREDIALLQAAEEADDEAYYRTIAEELRGSVHVDNASLFSDRRDVQITYDSGTGEVTAGSSSFVSGDVGKHIALRTATGYESGRYEITAYNSVTNVDVIVLQEPTDLTWSDWYMSFSTVSGLSQYNGQTVGIVADGGYLDDFEVSGGTVDLGQEATSIVVGYTYRGVIQSFVLGFQVQAENTQGTFKNVSRCGIRFHNSAGVRFGSTEYLTDPAQTLTQTDLNYLPPLPMNGTRFVDFVDDHDVDKEFVIVQDIPLPMTISAVLLEGAYAVTL